MSDFAKTMNEANAFASCQKRLERVETALRRVRAIASDAITNYDDEGPTDKECADRLCADMADILSEIRKAGL